MISDKETERQYPVLNEDIINKFSRKLLSTPIPTQLTCRFRKYIKPKTNYDKRFNYKELMLNRYRISIQTEQEKNLHIRLARKFSIKVKKGYKKMAYDKRTKILNRRASKKSVS